MVHYQAPLADFRFVLEALDYTNRVQALDRFEMFDLDLGMQLLETAARVLGETYLPLNEVGDRTPLKWDPETGDVTMPPGFKKAYQTVVDAGYMAMIAPPELGGMGAPHTLHIFYSEMSTTTNKSLSMCPGLTHGLTDALLAHGSEDLKKRYLGHLIRGEWAATMCLTEPQCGTDLGLMTTKAVPCADEPDAFELSGQKIWITFGDHDLTENIIHLVLARLPDAPSGIKGVSAFVVPKYLDDGTRNGVMCTGLEHKMGIHASPTCVMTLENARGYLVGEPHKGMRSMFVMMNMARLQVGVEGIGLGEIAYQTALNFAKERRQSRSLNPARNDVDAAADSILVHPDVRRMLLNAKATTEGMRGLAGWIAMEEDISHHHPDADAREVAADLVAILTPVVKSYCTERGFQNISDAMQVCGGAGFTTDFPIEQFLRDSRVAMIYEGTNGIQALDLVGRKLPRHNGRLMRRYAERVGEFISENRENEALTEFIDPLSDAFTRLSAATMKLAMLGMQDREALAAGASNYLNFFGLTTLAYIWGVEAKYALEKDTPFNRAKLKTARYFMQRVLPEINTLEALLDADVSVLMDFSDDEF